MVIEVGTTVDEGRGGTEGYATGGMELVVMVAVVGKTVLDGDVTTTTGVLVIVINVVVGVVEVAVVLALKVEEVGSADEVVVCEEEVDDEDGEMVIVIPAVWVAVGVGLALLLLLDAVDPTSFKLVAKTKDLSPINLTMDEQGLLLLSFEIAKDLLNSAGLSRSK